MSVDDAFPVGRRLAEHPWPWIVLISASVSLFLFWLIYFKGTPASGPEWVDTLPAFNALFNALSATCLVAGFINIRRGNRRIHMRFMLSAVAFSLLFLTSYVTYHHFHGDTPFPGEGWVRLLYFFILISHVTLSVVVVPLVLATLFRAARGQFPRHRRIARWTLPIWLYVSITGVVVFFFLRAYT